jgi:predicted dehydrogenase
MLKIAIVGCGKIADDHVHAIRRVPDCEIVALCDRELLMAQQLGERFGISACFSDLHEMLRATAPDVVHITTPPQSHYSLAKECVESGCHAYVEKPFTLYVSEAEELIALADRKGLKLTVGHGEQFSHTARRMRGLIRSGYLGGRPVHIESTWCYELGDSTYVRALLANKAHWVNGLPGGLLQNLISHGLAKIVEYLSTDTPEVIAVGFASSVLRRSNVQNLVDELRVIITEEEGTTAYFTFSSQMRPVLHQFSIYGPTGGLLLNEDQQTLIKLRGEKYKSYLETFVGPLVFAKQYLHNCARNVRLFLARDFHLESGMKYLIESFYRSIIDGTPVPIPYKQILLSSRIMDAVFEQLRCQTNGLDPALARFSSAGEAELNPVKTDECSIVHDGA